VQGVGAERVALVAANLGIPLVHMSAIGAHPDSTSRYARAKAEGERLVLAAKPDAVIFRPSIIFGPEDHFFNRFASMARISPALPLIGGGATRFQPVFAGDVARAFADAVDGKAKPGTGDPTVIFCLDEFGPLNLQPHPGKQWAPITAGRGDTAAPRRRRRRATYTRPHGVRHLMAGYDLSTDRLYGHVATKKGRTQFLAFARYLRSLHPVEVRIAIVLDNFSPHLSTKTDRRVGEWASANNVELAYTPTYSSWLNRIEAQFQALRYFALDGTDHGSHREQASMIRRYIIWRNRNAHDKALRELVKRANVA